MADHYILEGKTPVVADLMTWARWLETADRHVSKSVVAGHRVSTVFLGLNHQFGDGPPLLFETMVFRDGSSEDLWCERCSTWSEAEEMHARGEAFVKDSLTN